MRDTRTTPTGYVKNVPVYIGSEYVGMASLTSRGEINLELVPHESIALMYEYLRDGIVEGLRIGPIKTPSVPTNIPRHEVVDLRGCSGVQIGDGPGNTQINHF